MTASTKRSALKISIIYSALGGFWILGSDLLLEVIAWNEPVYKELQTLKGWLFVGITAFVLYLLLRSEFWHRDLVESELKDSLEEKKILINEIHHRVKNNLNSVISFLSLQRDGLEEGLQNHYTIAIQRVYSIALVHDFLYKSESYSKVDFGEFLPKLLDSIQNAQKGEKENIDCKVRADGVNMDISKAIPCGILINEIVTNSLKHGFPTGTAGKIYVHIEEKNGNFQLIIQDDGVGILEGWESKFGQGLGLTLISALSKQLSAKIEVDGNQGLKYDIRFRA
ncbi:sensor histidine kinase [Leptospira sarikeiensis]|uniref:histidine kinase n=1 Tax=Leptospira sarikeiensis TaxID=2484943 RepID=A0A4R9K514_9LEPT|nr:histidine kinase dimerization/phosphoacceptor domain -containing protein [Leptospira sarikeiensis]TGL60628.1 hypothetical protein EHQ64_12420 [Leptospira sarikeiensis]